MSEKHNHDGNQARDRRIFWTAVGLGLVAVGVYVVYFLYKLWT